MPRFLSAEWFAEVAKAGSPDGPEGGDPLVVEQVVEASPDGRITYRVLVWSDRARIVWPVPTDAPAPDLRISCGWETAVAVARGDLSTQRALMNGLLRVKGVPPRGQSPGGPAAVPRGLDPVPPSVRAETSY